MPRFTALALLIALATLGPRPAAALELRQPTDPLRSSVMLTFGVQTLDNESYADFFGESELNAWSLRYDYRVLGPLRLGVAFGATGKSYVAHNISLGSDAYPVRYQFTAFQGHGELYLRSHLPRIGFLRPHVSVGAVLSRIHAESAGYSDGYEANWQDYRPLDEVLQYAGGWRIAGGLRFPIWANVTLMLEASRIELDPYNRPLDADPPVSEWDHSGARYEFGLMQRF